MIEQATDFPLLGTRDYIHGTSVLSAFLAALEAAAPGQPATVQRIKFTRIARTNGRLLLTDGDFDPPPAACCSFSALAGATRWRGAFVDDGKPPAQRLSPDYPIDAFVSEGFSARCTIAPRNRDDLIRILIEANRRSLAAGAGDPPGARVKFGYLEAWAAPAAAVSGRGSLEITNLLARQSPKGWLAINRHTYRLDGGAPVSLQVCFDIELPARA
jgi:hypothetical protein